MGGNIEMKCNNDIAKNKKKRLKFDNQISAEYFVRINH